MTNIEKLAYNVLARKHLGIDEAMVRVLGEYNDQNANTFQLVFDEVQNILYPSGTDKSFCDL